jgi:hypothetical protein
MWFSAARYSFCSSNSWFTSPVTYDSRRAHLLFFIRLSIIADSTAQWPEYFDLTGSFKYREAARKDIERNQEMRPNSTPDL